MKRYINIVILLFAILGINAQERIVPIRFGDMEHWTVRYIKESSLLGGKTKQIYVLAPTDTIRKNEPYDFRKTCWGISNAYANVMGIAKAANTTSPERRGNGWCARLDTKIETVKVLGMLDIKVCIAGTLFLGSVNEPVRSANDPYASINMGVPFTHTPKALLLDIKAKVDARHQLVKALGLGQSIIKGHDEPEVYVFLQKRWEDKEGNIFATRVATARHRFATSIPEWKNNYRVDLNYGDITNQPYFKKYMGLFPDAGQFKAKNSKGKMVTIKEVGWASVDEKPTHVILMITGGCYPAFYGAPGNALWVDNVKWIY